MYRLHICTFIFCLTASAVFAEPRRIRVRPQEQEEESIQYYTAAEPQDDGQVVLVSTADQYNGLYGQPSSSRNIQENYDTSSSRESQRSPVASAKTKEPSKSPPVQTIRNYNKVNDDGSFTFGYEAADGSFKEETRGTDCVVRGKYGYIDPDGNRREFTYVSGNPCDPNAPKEESQEESAERESNEAENVPANYPTRPIRPIRPTTTARPVAVFQNNYVQEEEEPEPEQVLRPQPVQPLRSRPYISRPQYTQSSEEESREIYSRPTPFSAVSTTPSSVLYKQQTITPVSITPRPVASTTSRSELPATTYRPQLLQVAVTPRPSSVYTKQFITPSRSLVSSTPASSSRGNINFEDEFQKFQQDNSIISSSPAPVTKAIAARVKPTEAPTQGQIYSSALVYDPSSGQYNTQLYQTLPQTEGRFTVNQRIQPYVYQPQQQTRPVYTIPQAATYRQPTTTLPNQAVYQQQQAELQFQNSAQLYAQQQRARQQQQQQQQQTNSPQSFYYVQPAAPAVQRTQSALAGSQIDAFLRGHNIQF